MRKCLSISLLALMLITTAGCSHQHEQEWNARLESAEDNAAAARLHADEAYLKAEQAQQAADEANQRTRPTAPKVSPHR